MPKTIAANDNRHPAGRLEHGVRTLALQVRAGTLRPEEDDGPGIPALAFAEPGAPLQVPGPLIRVPQGTEIRVSVRNRIHCDPMESREPPNDLRISYEHLARPIRCVGST